MRARASPPSHGRLGFRAESDVAREHGMVRLCSRGKESELARPGPVATEASGRGSAFVRLRGRRRCDIQGASPAVAPWVLLNNQAPCSPGRDIQPRLVAIHYLLIYICHISAYMFFFSSFRWFRLAIWHVRQAVTGSIRVIYMPGIYVLLSTRQVCKSP